MNIVCHHCFATNRIPEHRSHTDANCGKCQQTLVTELPVELNDSTFYPFIERNHMPVIVDFWASWCGPCQNMAPVYNRVAKETDSILFAKVNTEQAQKVSGDAGIRSIPTLIFFYQGQEVDRVSGGLNEPQIKQWIMQCVQQLNQG